MFLASSVFLSKLAVFAIFFSFGWPFNEGGGSGLVDALSVGPDPGSLDIGSPVYWGVEDSPVNVTGLINILFGGALTIDSGVDLYFETPESGECQQLEAFISDPLPGAFHTESTPSLYSPASFFL